MKVGDRVKWVSQSHGHRTTKYGDIVEIIPGGEHVHDLLHGRKLKDYRWSSRDHESYLILVGGKYYYWPLVKNLVQIK